MFFEAWQECGVVYLPTRADADRQSAAGRAIPLQSHMAVGLSTNQWSGCSKGQRLEESVRLSVSVVRNGFSVIAIPIPAPTVTSNLQKIVESSRGS